MLVVQLDLIDYSRSLQIQSSIVERKIARGGPDVLLLLEHPPTITLGTRGKHSDLLMSSEDLAARGIALYSVDRGGEATYHGPGQLVCYPIVNLKSLGISVRRYIWLLEETILGALQHFGVRGFRQEGKVGVWTDTNDKIASIGVRIRRRITSHGFSLNVDLKTNPRELIVSCGMPRVRIVNLNNLVGPPMPMEAVRAAVVRSFGSVFGLRLELCSLDQAMG